MWSKQRHFWAHLSTGIIFTFARPCYVSQWGKIVSTGAFDYLQINQKITLLLYLNRRKTIFDCCAILINVIGCFFAASIITCEKEPIIKEVINFCNNET